jgi:hypothetical protein
MSCDSHVYLITLYTDQSGKQKTPLITGLLISSSFGDVVFHSAGSGFKGFGLDFKDTDFKTACYKKTEKRTSGFSGYGSFGFKGYWIDTCL